MLAGVLLMIGSMAAGAMDSGTIDNDGLMRALAGRPAVSTGGGSGAMPGLASSRSPSLSQCVALVSLAADDTRGREGDSELARALTMKAGTLEGMFRDTAASEGLDPMQVEIALAADRSAAPGSAGGAEGERKMAACTAMADGSGAR